MTLREAEEQSVFSEARQKSLGEFVQAGQAQLHEQNTAAHKWSTQHAHELFERSQEVNIFLSQGIKWDKPTGECFDLEEMGMIAANSGLKQI